MKTIEKQWLVAVAVCALALGTVASTKKTVERPIAWIGMSTVAVDLSETGWPAVTITESVSGTGTLAY
jgi:hypothetical protein